MPNMAEKLSTNPADHACSGSSASTTSMAAASVVRRSGLREASCASSVSISMTAARTEAAENPVSAQYPARNTASAGSRSTRRTRSRRITPSKRPPNSPTCRPDTLITCATPSVSNASRSCWLSPSRSPSSSATATRASSPMTRSSARMKDWRTR